MTPVECREHQILFIVATEPEAAPIKRELNLKRNFEFRYCPLYRKGQFSLIVTGIGKMRAAASVAAFISNQSQQTELYLASYGIGGSLIPESYGQIFCADRVIDVSSNSEYIPDHFLQCPFPLRTFETHDRAVSTSESLVHKDSIVDMESSGVLAAAYGRVAIERITLVRVISDLLSPKSLSASFIEEICNKHVHTFLLWVLRSASYHFSYEILSKSDIKTIESIFLKSNKEHYHLFLGAISQLSALSKVEREQTITKLQETEHEHLSPYEVLHRSLCSEVS